MQNKRMTVKGKAVPMAFVAALTGTSALVTLERLEGNALTVYPDKLANNIPTRCAGDTNHNMAPGTKLTSDQCQEINKATLLNYGTSVLACTKWDYLTPDRLIGLTLFAINVGKAGACNSQAFKAINAGNIPEGCKLLSTRPDGKPNWSYAGGVYVPGLQNRRLAERAWCER